MATMMQQMNKQAVASRQVAQQVCAPVRGMAGQRKVASGMAAPFSGAAMSASSRVIRGGMSRATVQRVMAYKDGQTLDRKLRVAVIGGGPSGACAAETLAKGGVEVFMIERKMDNCKVRIQRLSLEKSRAYTS